jgi:hypothetical protein
MGAIALTTTGLLTGSTLTAAPASAAPTPSAVTAVNHAAPVVAATRRATTTLIHQARAPESMMTVDAIAARPICKGVTKPTYHTTSCRKAAPGRQFRAGINCTNGGWRNGPWRKQTSNFSTKSTARCPSGRKAQRYRIQFR